MKPLRVGVVCRREQGERLLQKHRSSEVVRRCIWTEACTVLDVRGPVVREGEAEN